jgi:hypothetical protein
MSVLAEAVPEIAAIRNSVATAAFIRPPRVYAGK